MDISQAVCANCGGKMAVRRMTCSSCDVHLDSEFDVPSLARLSLEDQMFVVAFVRHHGSIKKMESLFGISYPTVKNRLNAIGAALDRDFEAPPTNMDTLERLARGELSVDDALDRLT